MDAQLYQWLKEKNTNEILRWLAVNPSGISYRDGAGVSLLLLSFYFKNQELADYILAARKPADIFEAVVCDDIDAVRTHLDFVPELIDSFSPDGFTPLGFAAYFSRVKIAGLLLERGANPEIPSRNAFTVFPLHSAVAANCDEIASMLLESGASPMVRQQRDITPLHSAAHNGNASMVKLLISYGADVAAVTADGKSVADMANEANASEVVDLLKRK